MLILQEVNQERQQVRSENLPSQYSPGRSSSIVHYYFSDYALNAAEASAMIAHMHEPIAVVQQSRNGESGPETEIRFFDSRESWMSWILHHPFGESLVLLEKYAQEARVDHLRADDQVGEFLGHIDLPNPDIEPKSMAVLHESDWLRGRTHAFSHVLVPDLLRLSVRQKAMSIRVTGAALLAQRSWFSGPKAYFIGSPVLELHDIALLKILAAPRSLAVL